MEYAHKIDNCIVGKEYFVAHAKLKFILTDEIIDIPIIPLKHADPQFGIKHEHYHIDGRFDYKDAVDIGRFYIKGGRTNNIIILDDECSINRISKPYKIMSIIYLIKKCIRKITGIDPPEYSFIYNEWYEKYIGKSCIGKKCPHFGTQMITVKGVTYCPLHGLHADSIKEIIVLPYKSR